jgi:hypothetical protein
MRNITVNVTVREVNDGGQFVEVMRPNMRGSINQVLTLQGSVMQRRFLLESMESPILLNVSERNNGNISVYLTTYTVYMQQ